MPRYKNLTHNEKLFLKWRHECLALIPSVELSTLLKNPNKLPRTPGVYIMWKKDNDRIYVGESVNVSRRLIQHATVNYPTQYIDREIRKYGVEHFRVGYLEGEKDLKRRREREGYYVSLFNSYHNGYNGSKDGNPMNAFERWWVKTWRKIMNLFAPHFTKKMRRANSFKGWRRLKSYAIKLKRSRRRN